MNFNKDFFLIKRQDPNLKFWRKDSPNHKLSQRKFNQNNRLYLKGVLSNYSKKTSELIEYCYTIEKNLLFCFKPNKAVRYINLEECIFKEVKQSPNDYSCSFKLTHNKITKRFLCLNKPEFEMWIKVLKKFCLQLNFEEEFELGKQLGIGHFSVVHEGVHLITQERVAVKIIKKDKMKDNIKLINATIAEVEIMRELSHPTLMNLLETFEDENLIYLIFELLKGGELFEKVIKKKKYPEKDAAKILKQMMQGLIYLEEKKIVHRDLKLENILLLDDINDTKIKIGDFGLSAKIDKIDYKIRCGTPGYVAPEILLGMEYNYKVDIFSSGVVLYILLSGCVPFPGEDFDQILQRNKRSKVKFSSKYWKNISFEAIDIVMKMLSFKPKKRPTSKEILESNWLKIQLGEDNNDNTFDKTIATESDLSRQEKKSDEFSEILTSVWGYLGDKTKEKFDRKSSLPNFKRNNIETHKSYHKSNSALKLNRKSEKYSESDLSHGGVASTFQFEVESGANYNSFYKKGLSNIKSMTTSDRIMSTGILTTTKKSQKYMSSFKLEKNNGNLSAKNSFTSDYKDEDLIDDFPSLKNKITSLKNNFFESKPDFEQRNPVKN